MNRVQREAIRREVCGVIADANRGRFPRCLSDWERAARRFGLRLHIGPEVAAPHVKYNVFLSRGVVYLPATTSYPLLHVMLLHEVSEVCLLWTGRPPCNYPPEWGGHHEIALVVDGRG